ncbi:MAG TPA: hypothetical protein VGM98_01670, partial [Schlesneria sp.]
MKILVYVDLENGAPTSFSRELANGARGLAGVEGTVDLALFGADPEAVGDMNADRILYGAASSNYDPSVHGAWLDRAIEECKPDLILFGYTTSGLDLGPVVAMRRDLPLLSYCKAVRLAGGKVEVDSHIYGGK